MFEHQNYPEIPLRPKARHIRAHVRRYAMTERAVNTVRHEMYSFLPPISEDVCISREDQSPFEGFEKMVWQSQKSEEANIRESLDGATCGKGNYPLYVFDNQNLIDHFANPDELDSSLFELAYFYSTDRVLHKIYSVTKALCWAMIAITFFTLFIELILEKIVLYTFQINLLEKCQRTGKPPPLEYHPQIQTTCAPNA